MKVGFLGDIHANLEALNKCLDELVNKQGCDFVMATGDIVGYGPQPRECIDRLIQLEIPSCRGNHDEYTLLDTSLLSINSNARFVIDWTRQLLDDDHRSFLHSLPDVIDAKEFSVTHASNCFSPRWAYVTDANTAALNFEHQHHRVSFNGHTHLPMHISQDNEGQIRLRPLVKTVLDQTIKHLVNVGSVGQPRDRNYKASTVTFDTESFDVEIHRVNYDISITQQLMRDNNFPQALIDRLDLGK